MIGARAGDTTQPGIYLYTGPFPTSDDAAGGCGRTDGTGAPLADTLDKKIFIADPTVPTPNAVVLTAQGTFYVSSVLNGVIAEFDAGGKFVRRLMRPAPGEQLPFPSTGTPLGLGVDASGIVYYADIGIVRGANGFGPGTNAGTVRRRGTRDASRTTSDGSYVARSVS